MRYLVGFVAGAFGSLELLLILLGSFVDLLPFLLIHLLKLHKVTPATKVQRWVKTLTYLNSTYNAVCYSLNNTGCCQTASRMKRLN